MIATALTYPPGSVLGLADNIPDATILGVTFGLSVLNNFVFGPRTSRAMVERVHQGIIPSELTLDTHLPHFVTNTDTFRNPRWKET